MFDTNFSIRIEFESKIAPNDRARIFINDKSVGIVKEGLIRDKTKTPRAKLIFRCSNNPFRNVIPNVSPENYTSLKKMIEDSRVRASIVEVALRNAIYNGYVIMG